MAAVGSNFGAKGPWADKDIANTARQESAGLESSTRGLTAKDPVGAAPAGQVGFDPSMEATDKTAVARRYDCCTSRTRRPCSFR